MSHDQGNKLRRAREYCHFTQQQVADALGVERSTYASYEIGRSQPNSSTLVILSRIFHVPLEQLVDEEFLHAFVQDHDSRRRDIDNGRQGNPFCSQLARDARLEDLSHDEHTLLCLFRAAPMGLRQEMIQTFMQRLHSADKKTSGGRNP